MIRVAVAAAVIAVAAAAAGCGGGLGDETATLWVTRDRGATVLVEARVASGQTAMQALDRETDLETRYGGRFVHSVNGIEGSLGRAVDWFYFVNGYEADRSAAEYRVRDGDVVWFDYRSWREDISHPVVVGAFPQPFRSGYDGERRKAVVQYAPGLEAEANAFARDLGATRALCCAPIDASANVLRLATSARDGVERFYARRRRGGGPGAPVEFVLVAPRDRIRGVVRDAQFHYEWNRIAP